MEQDGLDGGGTATRSSRCGLVVRDRPKDSPDQQEEEVTVESVPAVSLAVRCVAGLRAGKILSAGVTNHDLQHQGPLEITLGKLRYRLHLEAKDPYVADAKVMLAHTAGEHRCCTRLTDLLTNRTLRSSGQEIWTETESWTWS